MIYKNYGTTGMKVSAVGMGGMRFPAEKSEEGNARMIVHAYESGINYFDTAPGYGNSEDIYGKAFKLMPPRSSAKLPWFVSTKSMGRTPEAVRTDLENSLKRMGLDYVDVLHCWCIITMEDYKLRKEKKVLEEFKKIKEEGLAKHISVSTHLEGPVIKEVLDDYPFEGVLLGYSAMNFACREQGVEDAALRKKGVVVMNPLGGGAIPRNPERFAYLKNLPGETVTEAAIRFLIDDPRISVALVGLSNEDQLHEALNAVNGYQPLSKEYLKMLRDHSTGDKPENKICTGCAYCQPCPKGVPIVKFMDAYNQKLLSNDKNAIRDRLLWHWGIKADDPRLELCIKCGACEKKCTQQLPIISRLVNVHNACKGGK